MNIQSTYDPIKQERKHHVKTNVIQGAKAGPTARELCEVWRKTRRAAANG